VCDVDGTPLIQREDDREETVRARMNQQLGAMHDVVGFYRSKDILKTVDGRQPIAAVSESLLAAVDPAKGVA
jgi:adenylate kinase